ncbi:MAG: 1-acyl-sn-glycerol-3-phosphate acyltransferase [Deltaproteobacteria bacterium]|nr:MAG: 1-acyl-sn-glycerol-3-phosphate acyltransferase [Deltaproteobacteria bacterium]
MGRVLDWAVTLLFLPVFGLVLLVFEVVQRVAKAFGKRPHDYAVGGLCTSLVTAFRITGLRLKVERSPAVRSHQAYLIISNHQSMFDIALLGHVFFTNFPKFVSKRSLARRIPSVSYNLQRGGNCLIDRDDAEQALGAIRALGERVERNGVSAVIFPEGTRARAGALGAFKPRGSLALLAAAPATAIVPVAIDESWRLMRANFLPIPFGVRVRVHIGDPIRRRPDEDHAELLDRVHDEIAAALAAIRGETVELPRRAAAR